MRNVTWLLDVGNKMQTFSNQKGKRINDWFVVYESSPSLDKGVRVLTQKKKKGKRISGLPTRNSGHIH